MSKHTEGPWHDDGYRIYAPITYEGRRLEPGEDPRNGRVIVEYKHVDGFNPADGPLICAAPDLLAACEIAEARLHEESRPLTSRTPEERLEELEEWLADDVLPALRAALARAKGEPTP